MQKMSDSKLTDCPECGASALVRKISVVAFRLKGSGWYETDFKSENKRQLYEDSANNGKNAESSDKGDAKEKAAATDKKAESKSSDSPNSTKSPNTASPS